jgi:nicotinamide-nucleotide amidase
MISRVAILSTGDELTSGKIADTNAQWLADRCSSTGLDVVAVLGVGDHRDRITWAWENALAQADLVISTGGLGPTSDDLTTETVAALLGERLRFDPEIADRIRAMFRAMGREMPENNLRQAYFPESAVVIPNPLGTAPGYRTSCRRGGADRQLVVLPGVPREMFRMFDETVGPWIAGSIDARTVVATRTFQTFGASESALDERVGRVIRPDEARISYRASFPKIAVKLMLRDLPDRAEARIEELAGRVRAELGTAIYGEGEVSMEEVVGRALTGRGATVAIAESCSGGLIGHRLTEVPGSSAYFIADYVAYSNAAKRDVLGVSATTLEQHGAVSEEVAREMAAGARRRSGATVVVATTGLAGPDGGTPEKPVGTVCFALSAADQEVSRRHQLWGSRDWIKLLTSQLALDWLRRWALGLSVVESGFRK